MHAAPYRTARAALLGLAALALLAAAAAQGEELRVAIYVMRRDGSQLRKVVQVANCREHSSPRFSHDGSRLAFDAVEIGTGARKIYVVQVDGGGLQAIGEQAVPDWSPDDKQIAFRFDGAPEQPKGIWVQNVDGKGRVRVADGEESRWSPDGSRLACSDRHAVKLLDLVSGESRDLVGDDVDEVMFGCDWSPDGKRMAVVVRRGSKRELLIVSTEGPRVPGVVRLTRNLDGRVAWSPDGKRLAISAGRLLYLVDVDGKGTQMIPGQKGVSVEPAWSPDGQWLVFAGNHPEQPAANAAPAEAK